ncbi:MAG TPA: hypothetical protein VEA18_03765 [Candidatus Kapabacteria bacterium]|nr:hypothetical protein [Candidatus Kapabacteria bacterium]
MPTREEQVAALKTHYEDIKEKISAADAKAAMLSKDIRAIWERNKNLLAVRDRHFKRRLLRLIGAIPNDDDTWERLRRSAFLSLTSLEKRYDQAAAFIRYKRPVA